MTSFKSRRELATNSQFLIKVRVAMVKVAADIVGESPANPTNTPKDDKRHALGELVLAQGGPAAFLATFAEACASLGTLTTASTDADVEFTVGAVWDDLAGVSGAEA